MKTLKKDQAISCTLTSEIHRDLAALRNQHVSLIAAVPDLHGNPERAIAVVTLLEQLGVPVVFLGDYVDRGRSSVETIEILLQASLRNPDWTFLRGNHCHHLIEDLLNGTKTLDEPNSAVDEYRRLPLIPESHVEFLSRLPLYLETDNILFVHGGVSGASSLPISERAPHELLWTYDISPLWSGKKCVRGHRSVETPTEFENHVDLETGGWLQERPFTVGLISDGPYIERRLIGWLEITDDQLSLVVSPSLKKKI